MYMSVPEFLVWDVQKETNSYVYTHAVSYFNYTLWVFTSGKLFGLEEEYLRSYIVEASSLILMTNFSLSASSAIWITTQNCQVRKLDIAT